jgi:hypothetical protein
MANGIENAVSGLKGNFSDLEIALERAKIEIAAAKSGEKIPVLPEFATGARSVIYVNQKKVAAALDVSWSVNVESFDIRTIDSQLPWETIPGQISIEASLRRFIHPDRTAAGDHLFTIIQAALHTPVAALEVRDRLGNLLFFARGSFTSLQGQVSVGQMGTVSVKFQGYYWRQNDQQYFDPDMKAYDAGERMAKALKARAGALNSLTSQFTGAGVV